jgi:hypothetical protein
LADPLTKNFAKRRHLCGATDLSLLVNGIS